MATPSKAAGPGAGTRFEGSGIWPGMREGDGRTARERFRRRAAGPWARAATALWVLWLAWAHAFAAQIPPPPNHYLNDYAALVKPETAARLDQRLQAFERETSNQIVVAIFPNLPPDTDQFTFTTDVFRAWKPGQAGRDNGAILFVFVREHQIWIQTGRGLEGALPDAVCKRITADVIAPAFKTGQYDAGIEAGVNAMIAATRGEFRGTGRTHAQTQAGARHDQGSGWGGLILILVLFLIFSQMGRARRRYGYRRPGGGGGFWIFPSGGGSSGGGDGGFSGGGDGGFSGGGGDTGGGGAGSKW
ncbi:MAG: TPM domain-containing protein [Verrucomicrobia bacterium]|nr:TPM domain-containing protein [Verrucomicrobiota bacterium]